MLDRGTIPESEFIRFGMVLTYRCNASCKHCNRFLNEIPWNDTDLTLEDLRLGWEAVQRSGLTVEKVRMTGGENLLHPEFEPCMNYINSTWAKNYVGDEDKPRTVVFSNGILPRPSLFQVRYNYHKDVKGKIEAHTPPMISPVDLGLTPKRGTGRFCPRRRACGRLFDCHGFATCIFAGAIGRVIGVDPYKPYPVLDGIKEICDHCPWSMGVGGGLNLMQDAVAGKFEYPTKTYAEGLKIVKSGKGIVIPKFQERLNDTTG